MTNKNFPHKNSQTAYLISLYLNITKNKLLVINYILYYMLHNII